MNKLGTAAGVVAMSGLLLAGSLPANAGSADERRQQLDLTERQTVERLVEEDATAKRLFGRAVGYAVFNLTKGALILTGGGGTGVAVDVASGERTYMHVGMGGIGLAFGGQASRLVLLFEDKVIFDTFVRNGWHTNSSANAVVGRVGANADTTFTNGITVYELTDAGLLLQADISRTRFWQSKRLNSHKQVRTAQEILPKAE